MSAESLAPGGPPFVCPDHGTPLDSGEDALTCSSGHTFPVVDGIARFSSEEAYAGSFGYQWNRFDTTQLDRARGESWETFFTKTGLEPGEVNGRSVLEAGCGMGRFLAVVADAGARATGVDLSAAVGPAARNLGGRARVAQADIMRLPFAPGSFDVVYSLGVLHHTPDTKAAFDEIARMVRPGGTLAVWVYSREWRDRLASGLKYTYRRVTRRIAPARLERAARIAIPVYHLHRLPVIGFATRKLIPTSMHPNPEWRVLDTLDDYAPYYRWRHTFDEVESWFDDLGYIDVRRLAFPVAVTGKRP